jgi:predicted XRE-type DNA-binding protein
MDTGADIETIQALRGDVALQIARHVKRSGATQAMAATRLDLPQPTLSQIMNGRVAQLSLELLIRVAVRAGLPVVLQTGTSAKEAGAFVAAPSSTEGRTSRSRVADEAREALMQGARAMTPQQRLEAHARHSELVMALHRNGRQSRRPR